MRVLHWLSWLLIAWFQFVFLGFGKKKKKLLQVHIVHFSKWSASTGCCCVSHYCVLSFCSSPDSIATCWYLLLSGSVFVKEHMYLARCWYVPTHTHHTLTLAGHKRTLKEWHNRLLKLIKAEQLFPCSTFLFSFSFLNESEVACNVPAGQSCLNSKVLVL